MWGWNWILLYSYEIWKVIILEQQEYSSGEFGWEFPPLELVSPSLNPPPPSPSLTNHCFFFGGAFPAIPTCSLTRKNIFSIIFQSNHKIGLSPSRKVIFIYFNESPLKMMKNAFCFTLKALFVLEIFKFLSWLFGYVEKRLDKKAMVNSKVYDVTDWTTNNCNTYIAQYLNK